MTNGCNILQLGWDTSSMPEYIEPLHPGIQT